MPIDYIGDDFDILLENTLDDITVLVAFVWMGYLSHTPSHMSFGLLSMKVKSFQTNLGNN